MDTDRIHAPAPADTPTAAPATDAAADAERARRRAAFVARIRAANAETLARLADL